MPLSPPPVTPGVSVEKLAEIVAGAVTSALSLWFVGYKANKIKLKIDTRTADQKAIDSLQLRVGSLESNMESAHTKIEELRTQKAALQVEIVGLRQQISVLEIEKAKWESREDLFREKIVELEARLAGKSEDLARAEDKLGRIEAETERVVRRSRNAEAAEAEPSLPFFTPDHH